MVKRKSNKIKKKEMKRLIAPLNSLPLTRVSHSVFPLSKGGGGNPNFENFKKGGEPEKKFGVGETKRGGERFSKNKGGDSTFYVEFRDRKGQI